jgi:hypothetical protein
MRRPNQRSSLAAATRVSGKTRFGCAGCAVDERDEIRSPELDLIKVRTAGRTGGAQTPGDVGHSREGTRTAGLSVASRPDRPRGVRGYYHADSEDREELLRLRATAVREGISCFKSGLPEYYEWIGTRAKD